jgi:hypothetical protein
MRDNPDLSQRVKAALIRIQIWGDLVAMELFMHRQNTVKRRNIDLVRECSSRAHNIVSLIA